MHSTDFPHSLERIQEYIDIEHEVKPTEEGEPSAAWPTSGDLEVNNLSARYSPVSALPVALLHLTKAWFSRTVQGYCTTSRSRSNPENAWASVSSLFDCPCFLQSPCLTNADQWVAREVARCEIQSHEKADTDTVRWQSSLTLSLLRCIYTDGEVYYDGMPASKLNLDALRSNITIIPQVVSAFKPGCTFAHSIL